jgi:hypothetical protein
MPRWIEIRFRAWRIAVEKSRGTFEHDRPNVIGGWRNHQNPFVGILCPLANCLASGSGLAESAPGKQKPEDPIRPADLRAFGAWEYLRRPRVESPTVEKRFSFRFAQTRYDLVALRV